MIFTETGLSASLENRDWDFSDSKAELIHSIHPYPAKFISEIPNALMSSLPIPKNTIVLDPFCGSGVTLTEAQKLGIEAVGIDLNPIACLLSRVKTQALPQQFSQVAAGITEACRVHSGKIALPPIPNVDHWFKHDVQIGLTILRNEIDKIADQAMKDALQFCFSSIVVRVSNQDSDTRYAAVENKWRKDDVFTLFKQSAEKLSKAKIKSTGNSPVKVINKNALLIGETDLEKKVGMVITSPPYPNAYEYWLYHKYRMWWLGYDPLLVKKDEIGARAHYFKKNHQTVQDFIDQMVLLLEGLFEKCSKDAFVCFVIGRSKIHGKIIENEKIIARLGEQAGFNQFTTLKRVIRQSRKSFNLSHARIKEEYIVVLQK